MPTKVYIQTHGCAVNAHESEVMAGLLRQADFDIVGRMEDAFVIIINVCTVKGNFTALREIRKAAALPHKKLIIAGCITRDLITQAEKIAPEASMVSTHNMTSIASVVEEALNDNPVREIAAVQAQKLNLPKVRRNSAVAIVPISEGCDAYCSYCSVKLVKGPLQSYPEEDIMREVSRAVKDGCKEIWLTSQDNASYGTEKLRYSQLPELIEDIAGIEGNFMIRVGMMNPCFVKPVLKELVNAFKLKKVFKFVHLPVQSGSNEILAKMMRRYTADDFLDIVNSFKNGIPNITVATDVICGFPGETKEQFEATAELVKKVHPDVLNFTRFRPRPGTAAAKMKQNDNLEMKKRTLLIGSTFDWISFEQNKKWMGWKGSILLDEVGKDGTMVGRNAYYKPIVVEGSMPLGSKVDVKITNATKYCLIGEVQ